jgi:hypothetical protein
MDARLDGPVDVARPVGGQEQDPVRILQLAQKDGHDGVAVDAVDVSLLQEDVCLVHEQGHLPSYRVAECFLQTSFELNGLGAQVTAAD